MGILTRKRGDAYIITSDHSAHEAPTSRAPKRVTDAFRVWTGVEWSTLADDAKVFDTLVTADEYVRMNFAVVNA
jgi:hypothetical protein